ncbi:MAG: nuclear transport factor 2 family protein [bacterium]|nr:nuclear transport factor 2 family protein [bacterium]
MAPEETAARREDEVQLRDLAFRYARMMDRRQFDLLPRVFAADGILSGPGYEMEGHDQLRKGLQSLEQFSATLHGVLNTYFEIDGDRATGEVYCVANHLYEKEGVPFKLDMGIRYEDRYAREAAGWVIERRVFNMVWETDMPMKIEAKGQPNAG